MPFFSTKNVDIHQQLFGLKIAQKSTIRMANQTRKAEKSSICHAKKALERSEDNVARTYTSKAMAQRKMVERLEALACKMDLIYEEVKYQVQLGQFTENNRMLLKEICKTFTPISIVENIESIEQVVEDFQLTNMAMEPLLTPGMGDNGVELYEKLSTEIGNNIGDDLLNKLPTPPIPSVNKQHKNPSSDVKEQ